MAAREAEAARRRYDDDKKVLEKKGELEGKKGVKPWRAGSYEPADPNCDPNAPPVAHTSCLSLLPHPAV